jgi:hypothetical protein
MSPVNIARHFAGQGATRVCSHPHIAARALPQSTPAAALGSSILIECGCAPHLLHILTQGPSSIHDPGRHTIPSALCHSTVAASTAKRGFRGPYFTTVQHATPTNQPTPRQRHANQPANQPTPRAPTNATRTNQPTNQPTNHCATRHLAAECLTQCVLPPIVYAYSPTAKTLEG